MTLLALLVGIALLVVCVMALTRQLKTHKERIVVIQPTLDESDYVLVDQVRDTPRYTSNVEPVDVYRWPRNIDADRMLPPMDDRYIQYDGPTERVLKRPTDPVGPWERVGALLGVTSNNVLPLFSRQRKKGKTKYDYRTVYADVPVPIANAIEWVTNDQQIYVEPFGTFTTRLYEDYV